jgi:hypothetical protein
VLFLFSFNLTERLQSIKMFVNTTSIEELSINNFSSLNFSNNNIITVYEKESPILICPGADFNNQFMATLPKS